jgi:hypothetical protein
MSEDQPRSLGQYVPAETLHGAVDFLGVETESSAVSALGDGDPEPDAV